MAAALRALAIKPFEPLRFSAAVQASLLNRLRCSRLNACAVGQALGRNVMNNSLLETLGQIAGLGGLALGVFLIVFRDVLRKNLFARLGPTHSYRVLRLILVLTWSLAILGLVLWAYTSRSKPIRNDSVFSAPLPFHTGWIYAGVYDTERHVYLDGPFAAVAYRPGAIERGALVPKIGDVLRIVKDRRVIVADFRSQGLRNQMTSPPLVHNVLAEDDETGEVLEKGTLVIVRDVEISGDPGRSDTVWCRVAVGTEDDYGCRKALAELAP
jgi:hypothetical protein